MLRVTGAELVWTGSAVETGAEIVCDDAGLVTSGDGNGGEVLDATGCVVTPGLVNAHHHLLQTAFRTLPGTRGVPMRDWLPRMAAAYAAAGIDDELAYTAASAGLAEALLCGVTTVADHQLNWPAGGNGVSIARAVARAADELGAPAGLRPRQRPGGPAGRGGLGRGDRPGVRRRPARADRRRPGRRAQ